MYNILFLNATDDARNTEEKNDCFTKFFVNMRIRLHKLEVVGANMEEQMEEAYARLGRCKKNQFLSTRITQIAKAEIFQS